MGKKTKMAICPKCGRNCTVAFREDVSKNVAWETPKNVNHLENSRYDVECPGCGVNFIADINKAVPCWEE
jgi:ribosomal protein S27AE